MHNIRVSMYSVQAYRQNPSMILLPTLAAPTLPSSTPCQVYRFPMVSYTWCQWLILWRRTLPCKNSPHYGLTLFGFPWVSSSPICCVSKYRLSMSRQVAKVEGLHRLSPAPWPAFETVCTMWLAVSGKKLKRAYFEVCQRRLQARQRH